MNIMTKICKQCNKSKNIEDFPKGGKYTKRSVCKKCHAENYRKYYKETYIGSNKRKNTNPKVVKEAHLKYKYGMSLEDWNNLFNKQNGKCPICGRHQIELNKILCVDHNHQTNEIRGLLCDECNRTLGCAKDNKNILLEGFFYLLEKENRPL